MSVNTIGNATPRSCPCRRLVELRVRRTLSPGKTPTSPQRRQRASLCSGRDLTSESGNARGRQQHGALGAGDKVVADAPQEDCL